MRKCLFIFRQEFYLQKGVQHVVSSWSQNKNKNKQNSPKNKIVHELWAHSAVFSFIENYRIENTLKW